MPDLKKDDLGETIAFWTGVALSLCIFTATGVALFMEIEERRSPQVSPSIERGKVSELTIGRLPFSWESHCNG